MWIWGRKRTIADAQIESTGWSVRVVHFPVSTGLSQRMLQRIPEQQRKSNSPKKAEFIGKWTGVLIWGLCARQTMHLRIQAGWLLQEYETGLCRNLQEKKKKKKHWSPKLNMGLVLTNWWCPWMMTELVWFMLCSLAPCFLMWKLPRMSPSCVQP